ncbi:response regulator [Pseudomonas japonica]|uniref:response regulator n=1 Tax=Pseudomonas japonica TaxID=256466 RepID=UPI0015E32098|nr:response regulator [Pseudomonas japonica]MBA1245799.1 response regulator [Pseudomonas japonica]
MKTLKPRSALPHVLIVEDEELLRQLLADVIADLGTTVTAVETADAGAEVLAHTPAIDLLITDVRTPGQSSGWDLAAFAAARRPELPIIITSGFSVQTCPLPASAVFVGKPWRLDALCELVKARLGRT